MFIFAGFWPGACFFYPQLRGWQHIRRQGNSLRFPIRRVAGRGGVPEFFLVSTARPASVWRWPTRSKTKNALIVFPGAVSRNAVHLRKSSVLSFVLFACGNRIIGGSGEHDVFFVFTHSDSVACSVHDKYADIRYIHSV
ncbi:hypothetical protein ABK730_01360 [Klebsiella indica]